MMISQRTVDALIDKLRSAPQYDDVMNIARKNSYDKVYLVGGRVYRGLAEVLYDENFGFNKCDWDVLVMGEPINQWLPPSKKFSYWGWASSNYFSKHSLRCKLYADRSGGKYTHGYMRAFPSEVSKMDIISINDVKRNRKEAKGRLGILDDYFWGVPLDIQAIALDIESCALTGHGISAVMRKRIAVNNKTGTIMEKNYDPDYVANLMTCKALSLRFDVDKKSMGEKTRGKCTCYVGNPSMWLHFGCHCGGV